MDDIKNHQWIVKGYDGPPDNFLPTRTRLDTPLNPEVIARMKGFGFGTDDEIAAQLEEFILRQNFSKTMTSFFESSSPKSAYPTAGTPGSLSHSPSLISTNSTTGAILNNSASQGHISGLADGGGAAVNPTSQSSTSISTSSSSGAAIAALRTNLPPPLTTTTTASSTTKTGFFKSGSFSPQKFDLQRVGLKLLALKTEKAGKSSQGMIFPDNPIVNIYHLVAEKLERESALKALNVAANNASASGIAGSSGDHSNSRSTASGPQQQNFKEDASDADYFRSSIDSRPADMDDRGLLSSDEESPYRGRALTEPSSPAESGEDIRASEDDARAVSGLRLSRPESASLIRSVGGGSAAAQQSSSAHYKPAFKRRVRASSAGELDNFPSVAVGESTSGSKGGGLKEIVDKNRKRIKLPRRKKKRSRRNKKSRRGGVGGEDVVGEKGHWSDGELDSRSTRRDQPEKGGTGGVKQLMSAALKKLGRSAFNKTKSKSNPDNLLIVNSYNGNSNVPAASQLGPTGTGLTTTDTENEIMLSDSNGEFVNLDPSSPERPETNSSTVGIGGDGISAKKKSTKKRFKRVFQGGSSSTSAASVPPTPIDTIRPKSPPPQLLDIDTPGAAAPSAVIHSSALANLEETTSAAALVPRRESIAKSLFNRRLSLSSSMPFNIKDLGVFGPSSGTAAYTSSPLSTSSPPPPPLNENSTALRSSSSSAAAGKSLAAEREGAATSAFTTTAAVTVATIAHDAGVIDTEDGDEVDDQSQASAFPAPLSPIRSPLQAFDAEAAAGIEAPTGNILPMGGRADKKIKSVFLKGLFSVKNSSSKRAGLIRSDLIRVFENIGIQFEEWDGFFKCRFSQKVIVGTPRNLSPPKKAKSTHLTVKSSAISAAATLSSSYSQVSMGMASSSTTAGSNSTGVPAELVDLLQHDRGCGIVRGPTGYNSPKSAPRSEPGSPLAADLDEDEYSVVSASPAPPPLPTRPPLPPLPLPTPIPVTGDSVLAVSALIPQSSDATTSAAAVKESMPLYTSFTGNQNQQAASSAAVGTALQVASLFSSSSSSLEDEEEEANLGGVRRRDVRDDTEEEDNEEQEEFVLAPTYGSSPEKAIDATTATTSTTSPLILPPVASLAISTTTTSPAVDITGITSSSAAAVIGGGVVAVGASTSSGVSSPAQVTTPNLVRRIGERFNATTTNTVNSTSTHHTHYDEDLPAELVLPEGIDLVMRQVIFEVYIVKIGWLGLHGVQFRRISGDSWQYKKICHSILDKLRL